MKIIAHRGWSAGPIENTLEAFKKAHNAGVDAVEFDVRFAHDTGQLVVHHNWARASEGILLEDALTFLAKTDLELFIEMKQANRALSEAVNRKLVQHGLSDRARLFGWKHYAKHMNWRKRLQPLGMILLNPLLIHQNIRVFKPDFITLCFSIKHWTWRLFWSYWSVDKLNEVIARYPEIDFVFGVDDYEVDIKKVQQIEGLYGLMTNRADLWLEKKN